MIDPQALPHRSAAAKFPRLHLQPVSPVVSARRALRAYDSWRELSDALLLAAVAHRRSGSAFEKLYRRYGKSVAAMALEICGPDPIAQDIVQQTFMALWERAPRLAARSVRVHSWLLTVARNTAIDHVRSESMLLPLTDSTARTR